MAPHDRLSRLFFDGDNQLPAVLPHHLFMIAAAETSKETGLYPLTGMENTKMKKESRPQLNASRPKSPEDVINSSQGSEEEEQREVRLIIQITCSVKISEDGTKTLSLLLRLEDKMNRQLSCKVSENETPTDLANELVAYGLINEVDRDKVANKIHESLNTPA